MWDWVNGIFPCHGLSKSCQIDWSAAGAWAGAIATFFAVWVPFLASRSKEALRAEMDLFEFISELRLIATVVNRCKMELTHTAPEELGGVQSELEIVAVIPSIEPTTVLREVLISIRVLRDRIQAWNNWLPVVRHLGRIRVSKREEMIGEMKNTLDLLGEAVHEVVRQIKQVFPTLEPHLRDISIRK